ncbi:hypothetical protein P775_17290 [Puniceibacterium antarcticum]|uniref:Uncharacterized protein n=1 Tax=Puniceibacterium antarcticum TaxID=1206336 RepID=A0A2G8RBL0_9RHOB|nr:hypothetical protein P775_17290 [Puniceibacterium antarcticum]
MQRGPRLLKPYLIWSLIYVAMFTAQAVIKHQSVVESLRSWLPPEGSQRQLWFLP